MNDYFAHETAVIDEGCKIGKGTKIWHFSHVMSKCTIGESCNIGQNVVVSPDVTLGRNVKVQNNVSIYTGVINPRSAVSRKDCYRRTLVMQGASIGANATVVCGHDIGRYALIGAGAVVTKNIPDYALVVGNPARQMGWVSEYGCKLKFDSEGFATCPESGQKYKLENGKVTRIE